METKTIPRRDQIKAEHQWDLSALFQSDEAWRNLFAQVQKKVEAYDRFRGRLHESIEVLRAALDLHLEISRQFDRLYTYAHLKNDEDKSIDSYQALHQKAVRLGSKISSAASFIRPEIQQLPDEQVNRFLQSQDLALYRFYLQKIIRFKPHTLGIREEQLLALSREMARSPAEIFGQLDNVDLDFGRLTDADGRTVELSHGNFITFLMNPDRELRKQAFVQYYRAYETHRHTLAAALAASVKADRFYADARGFENCRQASLFPDRVTAEVYDALIDTVKAHTDGLVRYLEFRRERLGLERLHVYDTYVPLIHQTPFESTYERGVDICCDALAPLGREYVDTLRKGLLGGWVDRYENRSKRSGAYSSGCYDSPPYILLNFEDNTLNSLYTLAHEAGHSMHTHYANAHQPYVDSAYTIFVAEVASTVNECLLSAYLLERFGDNPEIQAYIINRDIDNLRATLFRQTMFADFESIVHRQAEADEPVTLAFFRKTYRELLDIYFGGVLTVDPVLELECLRIPHFYSAFYVYKYATGISAAVTLADGLLRGEAAAKTAYLDFLKLGGSRFPLDQLRTAGVDMASSDAIVRALEFFDRRVDRLITICDRLRND